MAAAVIAIKKARATERKRALSREYDESPNSGRRLSLTAVPERVSQVVSKTIKVANPHDGTGWRKYQPAALKLYSSMPVQVGVAGLILLNFLVNICQAQIDPKGKDPDGVFYAWDVFFNVVFLIELWLNMYSVWFCKFWHSSWNVFDFSVVSIGWLFQLNVPLPGPMKLLRMMRAFRVFRLFKRVKSLAKILTSLANAIPGVMNAFLIQAIVVCIFAIIAVDRFADYGGSEDGSRSEGGFMINEGDRRVALMTARETTYGFNYFGTFGKSLFTIFQCVTEESWVEAVARPLLNSNSPTTSTGAAVFFVLNNLLNAVILMNVVVAVLLEKMIPNDEDEKAEEPNGDDDDAVDLVVEERGPNKRERIEAAVESVAKLQKQVDDFTEVTRQMHRQLANVDEIRDMVAALVAHQELMVTPDAALASHGAASNGHSMRLASFASFETAGETADLRATPQTSPWPTPQASPVATPVPSDLKATSPRWMQGPGIDELLSPNGLDPLSPCLPNQIEEPS